LGSRDETFVGIAGLPHTIYNSIFFQPALLTLLRPLTTHTMSNIDNKMDPLASSCGISEKATAATLSVALQLCDEVSRAVLALTQTYARLFSLQRTPAFVPYFVYAAGSV